MEIAAEDSLYRRIRRDMHLKPDGAVASNAYNLAKGERGLSVNLARLSSPEETLRQATVDYDFLVGELSAQIPLENELTVEHDPQEDNEAHGLICGKLSQSVRRKLARNTRIVLDPRA